MSKTELLNKLEQQKDEALKSNKSVVTSISKLQDAQGTKPIKRRHRKKKKGSKKKDKEISPLKIGKNASTSSQTNTLSLKVYTEQLMQADIRARYEELALDLQKMQNADDYDEAEYKAKQAEFKKLDQDACNAFAKRVKAIDPKQFCVVSIKHDKDTVRNKDDLFELSIKKPHWHIYVWTPDDVHFYDAGASFRIHTVICGDTRKGHENPYLGITYDPKKDVSIWDHRGAERIHSIIACVAYALHVSSSAIEAGKHVYDKSEIITNLSNSEIDEMLNLYKGIDNHFIRKPNADDWNTWAQTAYERGLHLENFEDWAVDHFMVNQMASAKFRVVRDFYNRGLVQGLANAPQIDRCNIFILGAGNLGKSYNAQQALLDMGVKRIAKATSGTGKYDGVTADTEALLFNDTRMTQAKTVMEQSPVKLHRRNNNDPVWKGSWVAFTSNFDEPIDAAADCLKYQRTKNKDGEFEYTEKQMLDIRPILQRAFFCRVELDADPKSANYGHYHLVLTRRAERGGVGQIDRLCRMFDRFQKAFDKSIYNYEPEPVLEFQAKIKQHAKIRKMQDAHEDIEIPQTIGGHYVRDLASEYPTLPLTMPMQERAQLCGEAQAWLEYANGLDDSQPQRDLVQEDSDDPSSWTWADMVTRENNKKLAELKQYSPEPEYLNRGSEPAYLDDPFGEKPDPNAMPTVIKNELGTFYSSDVEIPNDFMENAYEYLK